MIHSKYTDLFCILIAVLTILATALFMNGERLGLKAVESDMSADLNGTYSDRDLEQGYDPAAAVYIDLSDFSGLKLSNAYELGGDLYLISRGTFVLSGEMSAEHSVIVDAKNAKLQIVLSGVTIRNESAVPIYVKKADKVFVTLDQDTENVIGLNSLPGTDKEEADTDEYVINAAVYSRSDLTINGSGSLTIVAGADELNGIRTSDDLVITGGTISVEAGKNGIVGHDSLRIRDGVITVVSGSDALKANNDTTLTSGYVQIDGGTMTLTSGDDGIHGEASVTINGGTVSILKSNEGIEAYDITVNDGNITVNASDDGFNAGSGFGNNMGPGGNPGGGAGGFGDGFRNPDGGLPEAPEGMILAEGEAPPEPPEGDMSQEGEALSESQEFFYREREFTGQQQDRAASSSESTGVERTELPNLIINGGTITVNAEGDGLDSNGNLTINGGLIYVNGPANNGNGSLDTGTESGGKLTVNGGTLIALGASGMAESFGEGSMQNSVVFTLTDSFKAGDVLEIKAASVSESIFSYTAEKSGNSVIFTSPKLEDGRDYILYLNGEEAASGTASQDTSGETGGFGNMGGGPAGGFGGGPRGSESFRNEAGGFGSFADENILYTNN